MLGPSLLLWWERNNACEAAGTVMGGLLKVVTAGLRLLILLWRWRSLEEDTDPRGTQGYLTVQIILYPLARHFML